MTTVEDRELARIDGLLDAVRDAEAEFRRSYARVLDVVAELEDEKAGAVAGFGTTARLLAGVLNLSTGEARTRVEQAALLTEQRELRVRTRPDGSISLAGKLDPEGGARVLEVLGSLNARRPPMNGVPDQRSQARRDADALIEAMSRLLDDGDLPARGR